MTNLNTLLKDFIELKNKLTNFIEVKEGEVSKSKQTVEEVRASVREKIKTVENKISEDKKEITQAKKAQKQIQKITGSK